MENQILTDPAGKLRPVIILIKNKRLINNGIKLLKYKMSVK